MGPARNELGVQVVFAIAEAENVEPRAVDKPLHEAINPDALNVIFRQANAKVVFEYHGYRVTVHGSGSITLDPL